MTPQDSDTAWKWWEARRLRYNIGLAIAGWGSYFLCQLVVILGSLWVEADPNHRGGMRAIDSLPVLSLAETLFLGIGYLFVMGAANICYCLGMIVESMVQPVERDAFRRRFFRMGLVCSCLAPFAFPAMVLIEFWAAT